MTEREAELDTALAQVERLLARQDSYLRVEEDRLVLSPLEADPRPARADALAECITERLPRVGLPELLIEVDTWTRFAERLIHAAGADPLPPPLLPHLYASLLAHACNFGLDQMAQSADLSYRHLAWCTTWHLREDTLKAACTALVNYHHTLPLSHAWGSGMLSSSDGQRFPVSGKNRHARRMPPPLGYGRGVTFYSWSSDQLSQYGTKCIPVTVRDSTYVLDEICQNETELPIREHTTDTAGATEIIFALFDLLGFRFAPRLRDLSDRRLFASGPIDLQRYPRLQPHVTGRIHRPRILDWWDELLRVGGVYTARVGDGLAPRPKAPSPSAAKCAGARAPGVRPPPQNLAYPPVVRLPGGSAPLPPPLNKGEALHDLRAFVMMANKGQLRHSRGEALAHQALCLNIVTNAVIVWNTVYMTAVVEQLKREGHPVQDGDLAHIWPTRYAHINIYGKYHFNVDEVRRRQGLRPFQRPGQRA